MHQTPPPRPGPLAQPSRPGPPAQNPQPLSYARGLPRKNPAAAPDASAEPNPPPLPPRAVTSKVRRRSWLEPVVRFWALGTLTLLAIALVFYFQQFSAYQREKFLISNGVTVKGVINNVGANSTLRHLSYPPEEPVDVKFQLNGQTIALTAVTLTIKGENDYRHVGDPVTLHVDPNHPEVWTDRDEPQPISQRMVAGTTLVPIVAAAFVWTIYLRRRVLRTWRDCAASAYCVDQVHRTSLAPLSHAVLCISMNRMDKRLITVYIPGYLPKPNTGDILWLLMPQGKHRAAIPALAYEG